MRGTTTLNPMDNLLANKAFSVAEIGQGARVLDLIETLPLSKTSIYELIKALGIQVGRGPGRNGRGRVAWIGSRDAARLQDAAQQVYLGNIRVADFAGAAENSTEQALASGSNIVSNLEGVERQLVMALALVRAAISQQASNQASLRQALPLTKLPAPAGAQYTKPIYWRKHIFDLWRQLEEHFGDRHFRSNELRAFMSNRVEMLPGDLEIGAKGDPRLHNRLHGAINVRPSKWEQSQPILRVGDHDLWKIARVPINPTP